MKAIQAYEGVAGELHRYESDALAEIICDGGRGTIAALLSTKDPKYQPQLRQAILRAAEILQKRRS